MLANAWIIVSAAIGGKALIENVGEIIGEMVGNIRWDIVCA